MKVQSRHLLTWGFVGAILLATPAIANAQDTSNYTIGDRHIYLNYEAEVRWWLEKRYYLSD